MLGVVILLLMMATAFMGYVLPWGQLSFWGATVITNLFSAIPLVGDGIVTWLWGGFSVGDATLNRFFVLHWVIELVPIGVACVVGQMHSANIQFTSREVTYLDPIRPILSAAVCHTGRCACPCDTLP